MEKKVMCPCCGKRLYRLGVMQSDPLVLGKNVNDPPIESDKDGHYMRCPHCSKRIVFISTVSPTGTGLRIGDVQPCNDCS